MTINISLKFVRFWKCKVWSWIMRWSNNLLSEKTKSFCLLYMSVIMYEFKIVLCLCFRWLIHMLFYLPPNLLVLMLDVTLSIWKTLLALILSVSRLMFSVSNLTVVYNIDFKISLQHLPFLKCIVILRTSFIKFSKPH